MEDLTIQEQAIAIFNDDATFADCMCDINDGATPTQIVEDYGLKPEELAVVFRLFMLNTVNRIAKYP